MFIGDEVVLGEGFSEGLAHECSEQPSDITDLHGCRRGPNESCQGRLRGDDAVMGLVPGTATGGPQPRVGNLSLETVASLTTTRLYCCPSGYHSS